ncbi:hypothetical protein I5M27_11030 [Adhaeribacter sp. BT258]|uniref:Outer membrane protein beta-barrel domain-containing protein n=1 Tax=Adhaeribacter terrigena TaxID=2793070 RepID=A0ABS1C300_9BACT|nr:hypothetical protein [Adhaeribacter terrigena]MBK0403521.1 hypothetical protein [Adhaeribacter terrigena]
MLVFLLFPGFQALAQDNIGLKFFGLSIHPGGDENAPLMPRRFDDKGIWVLNLGGMLSYEKFIYEDGVSVKAVQGFYSDCAAQPGGFSHIGLRARIFKTKKHSLFGGIGPTLVYRKNWYELPGYQDPDYFEGAPTDTWQYKFLWYGGEFEYAYVLTDKIDLAATFIPGYPKLISLSFGARYKFTGP